MPSFDIVSNVDLQELTNAIDQANRELSTRFDFKGTDAKFEQKDTTITLIAPSDFQLKQMDEILRNKLVKRSIDVKVLDYKEPTVALHQAKQEVIVKVGLDKEVAKKVIKKIKDEKFKVQTAIQGEQVRVTGKKRDDLQSVISTLRESNFDLPLQYENFRD